MAFVSDRSVYWIVLAPARALRVKLVLSIHVRLYRDKPSSWPSRLIRASECVFLRAFCSGVLAVSEVVAAQIHALSVGTPVRIFRGLWVRSDFEGFEAPAPPSGKPLHILFAGRLEGNKGIFDLLNAVEWLLRERSTPSLLEFCGTGSAEKQLATLVRDLGLCEVVTLRGHCNRLALLDRLSWADVVVVPTRSDFLEGYNKVAVEGVLARRPVISSSAIEPVLSDIRPAVMVAKVDDWTSYAEALFALSQDEEVFRAKVEGAGLVREQFFDSRWGWHFQASRLLEELGFKLASGDRLQGK